MNKPKASEPRNPQYLVDTGPEGRKVMGRYVGETDDSVVLTFGDGVGLGFPWKYVTPVVEKPQAEPEGSATNEGDE